MSGVPLKVELEFSRVANPSDPFKFQFSTQEYRLRTESGGYQCSWLSWDEGLIERLEALRSPQRNSLLLREVGMELQSFLEPLGWESIAQKIFDASREQRLVLLTIRSAAAELYALPWELLTSKATGQHVGAMPGVLLRFEWPGTSTHSEQPVPRHGMGRILFAWSAAGGEVPAASQLRSIETACAAGVLNFDRDRDVLSGVSMGSLRTALDSARRDNKPIAVVHLLAHGCRVGEAFGLKFDSGTAGEPDVMIDAGQLQGLLSHYTSMVRLVVLSVCNSADVGKPGNVLGSFAQELHRAGIASVVASRYPLSVTGAERLTKTLYHELLVDLNTLESALLSVRRDLAEDVTEIDWASLQLYARSEDGDATRPFVFRPYQWLSAFDIERHRFFFGRSHITERLRQKCQALWDAPDATKFLAILGPSGVGKSSLARAGLLASLQQRPLSAPQPWRTVVLRPGAEPLSDLDSALLTSHRYPSSGPIIMLIDQFEEVYTRCTDRTKQDLFVERLLTYARDPGRRFFVVITLRIDFTQDINEHHHELCRLLSEQEVMVYGMNRQELRQAIAEPARLVGKPLDEATIELLLSQAQDSEGALPHLEFALSSVWEGILAGQAPAAKLGEIGGVGGSLADRAQSIYNSLTDPVEKDIARRALVGLVAFSNGTRNTRCRAPLSELRGRGVTTSAVHAVLSKFADEQARLVTLDQDGQETVAEFAHEALLDVWTDLQTWIDERRSDWGLHHRAMEDAKLWHKDGRNDGTLWRSPRLDSLRDYHKRKPDEFGPLLDSFLTAAESRQKKERVWRVVIVAIVMMSLLTVAATYIAMERQQSREGKERVHQQIVGTYFERGRQHLFEGATPNEGLLWLHRAQGARSENLALLDLLKSAMQPVDAAQAVLIGHEGAILSARFSPDGRRIVTSSADNTARVWAADSGRLLSVLAGQISILSDATFSDDGRRLLTTSFDNTIRVWDAESGHLRTEFKGNESTSLAATYSPDGNRIITAGTKDDRAIVWEANSGLIISTLRLHAGSLDFARFSPDGRRIVTAVDGKTVRIWNASTGRQTAVLKDRKGGLIIQRFSPDGHRLLTLGSDSTAQVWDTDTGLQIAEFNAHSDTIRLGNFSPDGRRIVTASDDSTVRVWEADSGLLLTKLTRNLSGVSVAEFSPDGRRIVTASRDNTARIWDSRSGRLLAEFTSNYGSLNSVQFSPDGSHLVTASNDNTARVFRVDSVRLMAELRGHTDHVHGASFSPDGHRIVTISDDKTAKLWDANHGRLLVDLKGHVSGVWSATFSPDGHRLATASDDQTVRVWDSDSGRQVARFTAHPSSVWGASWSNNGRCIVIGSWDHTARMWDAETGQLLATFSGHSESILGISFSRDRRRIVTASLDKTARVWDADTGRLLAELTGHLDSVQSASFSSDGRRVVTASSDKKVRVWDADTGRVLLELRGHDDSVHSASFSPDGRRIVTASSDQTAKVWDAQSGHLLAELLGHGGRVWSALFSPDGRRVVTASSDQTAKVWDVSPEERTYDQLDKLIRCHIPVRFLGEGSDVTVFHEPSPEECQDYSSITPVDMR